jgi:hypothetical protein
MFRGFRVFESTGDRDVCSITRSSQSCFFPTEGIYILCAPFHEFELPSRESSVWYVPFDRRSRFSDYRAMSAAACPLESQTTRILQRQL